MAMKIEKQITAYEVVRPQEEPERQTTAREEAKRQETSNIIQMHEALKRPERLEGTTYKVSTPLSEHALYVTVNDIILNEGTEHEHRRPFEMFINSKNMDHFQWIVALTRIVSAVFRKGGDITFLVEELKAVFDPRGGYYKRGGKFMPSLVAELGDVIEQHLCKIGMLSYELDDRQKDFIAEKRAEYEAKQKKTDETPVLTESRAKAPGAEQWSSGESNKNKTQEEPTEDGFPAGAQLCVKCNTKAMIQMDNCMTCLHCGESKCG